MKHYFVQHIFIHTEMGPVETTRTFPIKERMPVVAFAFWRRFEIQRPVALTPAKFTGEFVPYKVRAVKSKTNKFVH